MTSLDGIYSHVEVDASEVEIKTPPFSPLNIELPKFDYNGTCQLVFKCYQAREITFLLGTNTDADLIDLYISPNMDESEQHIPVPFRHKTCFCMKVYIPEFLCELVVVLI